jgi:ubiquinone/menaquinone biosynthesis C-methylase UbiE
MTASEPARDGASHFRASVNPEDYADSYSGTSTSARFFQSRMHLVEEVLRSVSGGDLLDVGCGPGMMVQDLLQRRSGDFHITAVDSFFGMVEACRQRIGDNGGAFSLVASVEALPFKHASFDVVLAMGVLEYTDVVAALAEIARVSRAGALVVATMLNPTSPYRFFDWHIYAPLTRAVGRVQGILGLPMEKRRGRSPIDVRALRKRTFVRLLADAGLQPVDVIYFDINFLLPPVDRFVRPRLRAWQKRPERTIGRGPSKYLGTGFLVTAERQISGSR